MADVISEIPAYIQIKEVGVVLDCSSRTASRRVQVLRKQAVIEKDENISVRILCAHYKIPLSTLIRKLRPYVYRQLRKEFTISEINEMF